MCGVVAIIGLISILIMELFSLEEDDSGIFITQNGSENVVNMDYSYEDFEFPSSQMVHGNEGEVGQMHYSDISEDENVHNCDVVDNVANNSE